MYRLVFAALKCIAIPTNDNRMASLGHNMLESSREDPASIVSLTSDRLRDALSIAFCVRSNRSRVDMILRLPCCSRALTR